MAITVPEAARRASVHPETIRRWIWAGRLPARKFGNQYMVEEADLAQAQAGSLRPARADYPRDFTDWVESVERMNREDPLPPGAFDDLEDIINEIRGPGGPE